MTHRIALVGVIPTAARPQTERMDMDQIMWIISAIAVLASAWHASTFLREYRRIDAFEQQCFRRAGDSRYRGNTQGKE